MERIAGDGDSKLDDDVLVTEATSLRAELESELASLASWRSERANAAVRATGGDYDAKNDDAVATTATPPTSAAAAPDISGTHAASRHALLHMNVASAAERADHDALVQRIARSAPATDADAGAIRDGTLRMHAQLLARQRLEQLGLTADEIAECMAG